MKIIKELIPYVVIVVVVVLFRTFIATPVIVSGSSMDPTLKDGEVLVLNKLAKKYNREDIVVIDADINGNKERIVKRIIGMPGEKIEYVDHSLYINDEKVFDSFNKITNDFNLKDITGLEKIPEGYYFVMGDNRDNSLDSRDSRLGLIKEEDIIGKPIFRIWPLNKMGTI